MNWKTFSYSVSTGISFTALSYVLYKQGGEILLWPGIFMEVLVNGLMLFINPSDNFLALPEGAYLVFSAVFYSALVFVLLTAIVRLFVWRRRRTS